MIRTAGKLVVLVVVWMTLLAAPALAEGIEITGDIAGQ